MSESSESRPNRRVLVIVIVVVVAAMLLCGCAAVVAVTMFAVRGPGSGRITEIIERNLEWPSRRITATIEAERTFTIGEAPIIEIDNGVGDVRVVPTDAGQVTVKAKLTGYGENQTEAEDAASKIELQMEQLGDAEIRVIAKQPTGLRYLQSPKSDLTLYVPRDATLHARVDVGSMEIKGIAAPLDLSIGVGGMRVREHTLAGNVELSVDVGDISITLPEDSAFALDAHTGVGDIDCAFAVSGSESSGFGPSDAVRGTIGGDGEYAVTLKTGTGSINIRKD